MTMTPPRASSRRPGRSIVFGPTMSVPVMSMSFPMLVSPTIVVVPVTSTTKLLMVPRSLFAAPFSRTTLFRLDPDPGDLTVRKQVTADDENAARHSA